MTARLVLLALALSSAAAVAQTPPCASLNDTTTTVNNAITAMGASPNQWAWQYTPAQTIVAQALQIYTANRYLSQSMGLEIWSNDPATSLPKARLAGGYWKLALSTTNAWQGTNLDLPMPLLQGTSYWIVWVDPAWSTVPTEPGGTTLPFARISGTTWITGTASALKVRLFCSWLDQMNVTIKGTACPSPAGLGTAFVNQPPMIGNGSFMIEGTGFPAGVGAILILGIIPSWPSIQLPGAAPTCFVHTDPALIVAGTTGSGDVRAAAGAPGQLFFALPIPANPALVGGILPAQLAALDASSTYPVKVVTSNGLRSTLY